MKHRIGGEYNEQLFQPQYANGVFVQVHDVVLACVNSGHNDRTKVASRRKNTQ